MTGRESESLLLKTLRLLYVEDDPVLRDSIGAYLAHKVGKVAIAADGEEGLAAFRAQPAQIVVTDIRMPHMDGLAMAREIRALDPRVGLVVTTGFDDQDGLFGAIAVEVDQYVLKPIRWAHLEFALLSCARRQRNLGGIPSAAHPLDADGMLRLARLTPREREVLARVGRGRSSRDIGLELGISARTVHVHQANLMLKLGLHKSTALAVFAVRAGIL
jgi:DNA-binding NarL/FixJ family response regulator